MNECRMRSSGQLVAVYADCHRRVFPVINTCLNNITAGTEAVDPTAVSDYSGTSQGSPQKFLSAW